MAEYNGWTNYETWSVNMWLTDNDLNRLICQEMARTSWELAPRLPQCIRGVWNRTQGATFTLEDRLKSDFNLNMPTIKPWIYSTMAQCAMEKVNWREIAEHFIEAVVDEAGEIEVRIETE